MADIRALIAGDEEQATPARAVTPVARKIAPAAQASSDVDRSAILQSEYAKAKARLAAGDTRAQGDIAALTRELKAAGATPIENVASIAAPIAQPIAAPITEPNNVRALIAGDGTTTTPVTQPPPASSATQHFIDAFNTIRSAKKDIGQRIAGGQKILIL